MTRRRPPRIACVAALAAACAAGAGCGVVDAPPDGAVADRVRAVTPDAPAARRIEQVRVPVLSRDGFARRAAQITLRVRNLSCTGLETGSGFAISGDTLITNRHVIEGAELLEVNTSDGRSLRVRAAEVGTLGDVAFVTVDGTLPVAAHVDGAAPPGSEVVAVGYPLGGPLTLSRGTAVDRVDGSAYGVPGAVLRTSAEVRPGNSGGPLLDGRGRVAGVVYAIEVDTGLGLAIAMDTVRDLVRDGGTGAVPECV